MKKLLHLVLVAAMVTASGCIVYPGYDGYYDSGYYGGSYGYAGPNVNLYYSNMGGGYRYFIIGDTEITITGLGSTIADSS